MIDFFGPGFDAADRMGLGAALQEIHYPDESLLLVDRHEKVTANLPYPQLRKAVFANRHYNFMRGDLERVLLTRLGGLPAVRFGVSPRQITFRNGRRRRRNERWPRRTLRPGHRLQANALLVHHVGDIPMASAAVLSPDAMSDHPAIAGYEGVPDYEVLLDGERPVGIVSHQELTAQRPPAQLADLARHDLVVVRSDATIFDLIGAMQCTRAELGIVTSTEAERQDGSAPIRGVVTKRQVAEAVVEGLEILGD